MMGGQFMFGEHIRWWLVAHLYLYIYIDR
jgi:hypothetical protein